MPKPLSGVRADSPRSYRSLEQVAAYVRQRLKLSPEEAIKPLQLFESLDDIRIEPASGNAVPLWHGVIALDDSEGYTRYDSERGLIEVLASEQTYEWLEQGHSRATFFVPHELGHCLLHTEQLIRLAQMPTRQLTALYRGTAEHRAFEDTEWQANAFACALLMPAGGLVALEQECRQLTSFDIAERYGVSIEAASYRLDNFTKRRAELAPRLGRFVT